MQKFKNKTIDGEVFHLSHLNDVILDYQHGTDIIRTLLRFSSHCFTDAFTDQSPKYLYNFQNETRAFSVERYNLSYNLIPYFRSLSQHVVYLTTKQNYFLIHTGTKHYFVFFDAKRAKNPKYDVIIDVQSAYPRKNYADVCRAVDFLQLLSATAQGKQPRFGPEQPLKRS